MSAQVLRKRLHGGWTGVPNATIRDARISLRATGLLVYLLSMDDGWPIDSTSVSRHKVEGREAIRTAFRELVAAGYVKREKRTEGTRWTTDVFVSDVPAFAPGAVPEDGFPGAGFPGAGKPGAITEDQEKNPPKAPRRGASDDPHFIAFWDAYPRKIDKGHARRAWDQMIRKGIDPETIIAGAHRYAAVAATSDPRFVAHASTWLRGERWEDAPDPVPPPPSAPPEQSGARLHSMKRGCTRAPDCNGWELGEDGMVRPCPTCRQAADDHLASTR